jgi:hypothetical protein
MRYLLICVTLAIVFFIPNTFRAHTSAQISFSPHTTFPTGVNPRTVVSGDFNNDCRLDLITANFGSASISILLGNINGTFGPRTDIAAGNAAHSLATGDFNKDEKLDIAVTNAGNTDSDTVSILLGNGDGTFGPRTSYPTGREPLTVVAKDFNQDSNLDLAVVNQQPKISTETIRLILRPQILVIIVCPFY